MNHLELAEDIECHQCGYNLRGLSIEGDCPECGLKIWTSLYTEKPISKCNRFVFIVLFVYFVLTFVSCIGFGVYSDSICNVPITIWVHVLYPTGAMIGAIVLRCFGYPIRWTHFALLGFVMFPVAIFIVSIVAIGTINV